MEHGYIFPQEVDFLGNSNTMVIFGCLLVVLNGFHAQPNEIRIRAIIPPCTQQVYLWDTAVSGLFLPAA